MYSIQTEKQKTFSPRHTPSRSRWQAYPDVSPNTIQRKSSCACGGACPKCQAGEAIQAKLNIGAPNDKYEQEADRIAEQVVNMNSHDHGVGNVATLTGITGTEPFIARAPSKAGARLPDGVAPQWPEVASYVQNDLNKTGFGTDWFAKKSAIARQAILNLYVKLKGLDLWRYVESNAKTSSESTLEFKAKHHELREVLTDREDFTDPDDSLTKWSSREKKASASLHFKHFKGWPEKQVQAHIDPIGVHGSSIPIIGPLILGIRHLLDYSGYKETFRIRNILLDEGWDPVGLSGVTASPVMRKAENDNNRSSVPDAGVGITPVNNGQPLPATVQNYFEPRLGYGLGGVRIHTDTNAARSAQSINARAYTLGNNVVFNKGEYSPGTHEGKKLLAHELTHVIQQQGTNPMIQREPVFPDETCSKGNVQERIVRDTAKALELVSNAVSAARDPDAVAGTLGRIFHLDMSDEHDRNTLFNDRVVKNLESMKDLLSSQIINRCDEDKKCGYRAGVPGVGMPDEGVYFCLNMFKFINMTLPHQVVNSILHEYAHMAGVWHGVEGEVINENSVTTRGLDKDEATNHAEVYVQFIRAVQ